MGIFSCCIRRKPAANPPAPATRGEIQLNNMGIGTGSASDGSASASSRESQDSARPVSRRSSTSSNPHLLQAREAMRQQTKMKRLSVGQLIEKLNELPSGTGFLPASACEAYRDLFQDLREAQKANESDESPPSNLVLAFANRLPLGVGKGFGERFTTLFELACKLPPSKELVQTFGYLLVAMRLDMEIPTGEGADILPLATLTATIKSKLSGSERISGGRDDLHRLLSSLAGLLEKSSSKIDRPEWQACCKNILDTAVAFKEPHVIDQCIRSLTSDLPKLSTSIDIKTLFQSLLAIAIEDLKGHDKIQAECLAYLVNLIKHVPDIEYRRKVVADMMKYGQTINDEEEKILEAVAHTLPDVYGEETQFSSAFHNLVNMCGEDPSLRKLKSVILRLINHLKLLSMDQHGGVMRKLISMVSMANTDWFKIKMIEGLMVELVSNFRGNEFDDHFDQLLEHCVALDDEFEMESLFNSLRISLIEFHADKTYLEKLIECADKHGIEIDDEW